MSNRQAGLLLHPSSLPGGHGIGDLGDEATRILDWMASAGLTLWQILPLGPVGVDGSPYSSWSALAGNPLLVDLRELARAGLCDDVAPQRDNLRVDFAAVAAFKLPHVHQAAAKFVSTPDHPWHGAFSAFCAANPWAEQAALFATLRDHYGNKPWWCWPASIRDRRPAALKAANNRHRSAVTQRLAVEFFFDRQWRDLRRRAAERNVQLFGDVPIYVGGDSVDVWGHRNLFALGPDRRPTHVAGVPPDAFSDTGQMWGNPLYRWDAHRNDGFAWWIARLRRALTQCDLVRIDHFRAFAAYWQVPVDAADARSGSWQPGPGAPLFEALTDALGDDDGGLALVAEDLGTIDDDVHALMASAGLPGMEVLQFAFDGDPHNGYLPHNHRKNAVAYVGTHDNDTALGWWQRSDDHVRHRVRSYLGVDGHDIVWDLMRMAVASVADIAILTAQDVLALDGSGRMNIPGKSTGNWGWRLRAGQLQQWHADRVRQLVERYGRLGDA